MEADHLADPVGQYQIFLLLFLFLFDPFLHLCCLSLLCSLLQIISFRLHFSRSRFSEL
nr:MAG TPA: hypothetical protein [Caudoviricetes sp.]